VNVQPEPGVPSTEVGTVIVTRPGVSLPDGLSWATDTDGVPTLEESDSWEPEVAGRYPVVGAEAVDLDELVPGTGWRDRVVERARRGGGLHLPGWHAA